MTDDMAQQTVNILSSSSLPLLKEVIQQVFKFGDASADICRQIYQSTKEENALLIAQTFWDKVVEGSLEPREKWLQMGQLFWQKHRPIVAQEFCSMQPKKRLAAVQAIAKFKISDEMTDAIRGKNDDFIRLALLGKTWLFAQILSNATNSMKKNTYPAIRGITAAFDRPTIPHKYIMYLVSMNDNHIKQVDHSKYGLEDMVPIPDKAFDILRSLLSKNIVSGLCHSESGIRQWMADSARILKMDPSIQRMIQGDTEDFERLAIFDNDQVREQLMSMAILNTHSADAASRGLMAAWNRQNNVPLFDMEVLKQLISFEKTRDAAWRFILGWPSEQGRIQVSKENYKCSNCDGCGKVEASDGYIYDCGMCNGKGIYYDVFQYSVLLAGDKFHWLPPEDRYLV